MPPARRSTRARGCSGSATRAVRRCRSSPCRAIRRRSRSRRRARRRAGLLVRGLKTALLYAVRDLGEDEAHRRAADLAASYEHAIVEALIARIERALAAEPGARLAIGGGVAANRRLRERARGLGVEISVPPPELCTDNAAMIGSAARYVDAVPFPEYLALDAYATGRRRAA
jgi:predicted NodU family carbamoyl transferase